MFGEVDGVKEYIMEVIEGGLSKNGQRDDGCPHDGGGFSRESFGHDMDTLYADEGALYGDDSLSNADSFYEDVSSYPTPYGAYHDEDEVVRIEGQEHLDFRDEHTGSAFQDRVGDGTGDVASHGRGMSASQGASADALSENDSFGNLFGGFVVGERTQKAAAHKAQASDRSSHASSYASRVSHARSSEGVSSSGSATMGHSAVPSMPARGIDEGSPLDRRWAWVEIHTGAIRSNLLEIRKRLSPGVAIMAVVKADAYGHGAVQVAEIALRNGATRLGVATVDEGIELRKAGIAAPIQLLSQPPTASVPLLLDYQLIPAVYTFDFALALGEEADARGTVALYHLKVNTGMNRIGVPYAEVVEFVQALAFHRSLEMEGIFTHFATADAGDSWGIKLQLSRFEEVLAALRYAGIDPGIIHAAASAAAIRFKPTHFDMVRIGIALYGLHPSELTKSLIDLRPAMEVHARVTQLSAPSVGEGVSYGFTYQSPGSVLVATIPIGYADGLPRILSNHMHVSLKGRAMPQVGNICMDQTMFEVTQRGSRMQPVSSVEIGDEVVVIGDDAGVLLTLDDMAAAIGTINYELACHFGMRMPRVYITD